MSDDEKLYRKALSLSDKFEYELAAKFLARILGPYFKEEDKDLLLSKGPPHLEALQLFASLCLELGDVYSSVKAYDLAVTFFPNEHIHYLSLAQLVDPEDAIELYLNGADILRNKGPKEESDFICLSRIYCSIAELYIADLCHHEKADESAHKFLALARDAGPVSEKTKRIVTVEILYLQAQLHLNQSNKDEAVSSLMSSYSEYKKLFEIRHKESSALDSAQLPSFELRVQMAKLALELQLPDLCLDILAECLEERDDLPDIYYFIGLAHFAFVKGGLEGDDEDGSRAIENLKTAKKLIYKEKMVAGGDDEYEDMDAHIDEILLKFNTTWSHEADFSAMDMH